VTARLAFARNRGVRHTQNAREGPPLEALRGRRMRCAAAQVRGGDSSAERRREPSLGSARSRRTPAFLRKRGPCAARQLTCLSRKRRCGGRRRQEGSHLLRSTRSRCSSWLVPVRRRIAEVGRTPSGSEKRAIPVAVQVESLHPYPERVNGSLTAESHPGARAAQMGGKPAAKGGWFSGARRSSSRERRRDRLNVTRQRFRHGGRGVRKNDCPMEDAPDRECDCSSRGKRGIDLGGLRSESRFAENDSSQHGEGGDRSVRGERHGHARWKKTPPLRRPAEAEVRDAP